MNPFYSSSDSEFEEAEDFEDEELTRDDEDLEAKEIEEDSREEEDVVDEEFSEDLSEDDEELEDEEIDWLKERLNLLNHNPTKETVDSASMVEGHKVAEDGAVHARVYADEDEELNFYFLPDRETLLDCDPILSCFIPNYM